MSEILLLAFEIAGTVAFAVSGALLGLEKRMDILGISILGLTTAVGGGVIRDIILGITPPMTFRNPLYAAIAIGVSVLVFVIVRKRSLFKGRFYEITMLIMDSTGLGVFTVIGINTAFVRDDSYGIFLLVFVGVMTGVGGGILRDVMAGDRPYIFVKHFYASASIIGALVCVAVWDVLGSITSMFVGTAVVIVLRLCAARFRWSLPKVQDPSGQ